MSDQIPFATDDQLAAKVRSALEQLERVKHDLLAVLAILDPPERP